MSPAASAGITLADAVLDFLEELGPLSGVMSTTLTSRLRRMQDLADDAIECRGDQASPPESRCAELVSGSGVSLTAGDCVVESATMETWKTKTLEPASRIEEGLGAIIQAYYHRLPEGALAPAQQESPGAEAKISRDQQTVISNPTASDGTNLQRVLIWSGILRSELERLMPGINYHLPIMYVPAGDPTVPPKLTQFPSAQHGAAIQGRNLISYRRFQYFTRLTND